MTFFPIRLVASRMLAPAVREFSFERVDGEPFAFVPGQYLQVHFTYPDGTPTKRSYSIGTPSESGRESRVDVAAAYVEGGAGTALMAGLTEGAVVQASGPYGRLCLSEADDNRRYLLVGTGTGVMPYRSMLPLLRRHIERRGCEVALVCGARSEAELLHGAEFEAFAGEVPGFSFHACLSREPRAVPHPNDHSGRVQSVLAALAPDPARDIAYLCGNPNMVDECFALLSAAGLPAKAIRREKYVSVK